MTNTEQQSVDKGTSDVVCVECRTSPRLKSLNKNHGTCVGCDCEGVKYSMDTVPYELGVDDLPEPWIVIDGRSARQMAKEVDAMMELGVLDCPECGNSMAFQTNVSCNECGFIPEEVRA